MNDLRPASPMSAACPWCFRRAEAKDARGAGASVYLHDVDEPGGPAVRMLWHMDCVAGDAILDLRRGLTPAVLQPTPEGLRTHFDDDGGQPGDALPGDGEVGPASVQDDIRAALQPELHLDPDAVAETMALPVEGKKSEALHA